MSEAPQRLQARIYGRVQGVGFRVFVRDRALALGLVGFARNKYSPQPHVHVVAQGPEPALQQLLQQLQRGPALAYVEHVDVQWGPATDAFSRFRVG